MSLYPRGRQQSRDRLAAKRAAQHVDNPSHVHDWTSDPAEAIEPPGLTPAQYVEFWRNWLNGYDTRYLPPMPRHAYQDNYNLATRRIREWSAKL